MRDDDGALAGPGQARRVRPRSPGEVIRRIEAKGYALVALSILTPDRERLALHYAEHEGKPFYEPLVDFMSSGPVTAVVIEGHRCIEGFRALAGATDPTAALPGTIRGDLGRDWGLKVQQNIVHGSDSPESSAREIGIWFPDLCDVASRLLLLPPGERGGTFPARGDLAQPLLAGGARLRHLAARVARGCAPPACDRLR